MLNQFVVVGRIETIDIKKTKTTVEISIGRSYKNKDGDYDRDYIKIEVDNKLAENTLNLFGIGDIIGVKGKFESNSKKKTSLIAERITHLSKKEGVEA